MYICIYACMHQETDTRPLRPVHRSIIELAFLHFRDYRRVPCIGPWVIRKRPFFGWADTRKWDCIYTVLTGLTHGGYKI